MEFKNVFLGRSNLVPSVALEQSCSAKRFLDFDWSTIVLHRNFENRRDANSVSPISSASRQVTKHHNKCFGRGWYSTLLTCGSTTSQDSTTGYLCEYSMIQQRPVRSCLKFIERSFDIACMVPLNAYSSF